MYKAPLFAAVTQVSHYEAQNHSAVHQKYYSYIYFALFSRSIPHNCYDVVPILDRRRYRPPSLGYCRVLHYERRLRRWHVTYTMLRTRKVQHILLQLRWRLPWPLAETRPPTCTG
jgi:hypothetical protein